LHSSYKYEPPVFQHVEGAFVSIVIAYDVQGGASAKDLCYPTSKERAQSYLCNKITFVFSYD